MEKLWARSAADRLDQWIGNHLFNSSRLSAWLEPWLQTIFPLWRTDQFNARVLEIRPENDEVYTLRLIPDSHWPGFRAGQFVGLTLMINGVYTTRYFSISSSPQFLQYAGIIELTIKKQPQGLVTNWIPHHLLPRSRVALTEAQGSFLLGDNHDPLLFIAGGSGITPFRSMLQSLEAQASFPDIHLLYYCDGKTHLFAHEFARLSSKHTPFRVTLIDALVDGQLSERHLAHHVPDFKTRRIYLCGPAPMMAAARSILAASGVEPSRIHSEYFGAVPPDNNPAPSGRVTFTRTGKTVLPGTDAPQTLLELAEQEGLRPTTGCRAGICHQCVCRKRSGKVYNTLTHQISESGEGDVQLCIAVPVTDVVLEL